MTYNNSLKEICRIIEESIFYPTVFVVALYTIVQLVLYGIWGISNHWLWISLSRYSVCSNLLMLGFCCGILGYHYSPLWVRWITRLIVLCIALVCFYDTYIFYILLFSSKFSSSLPVPLSLLFACCFCYWTIFPPKTKIHNTYEKLCRIARVIVVISAYMCLQIHMFGSTDYRRPADAIVVLGAGVYEDGTPSIVLLDRIETACQLYNSGLANRIVFSGGRNPNAPISEPQAMRKVAMENGIPEEHIVLDEAGINTQATAINTHKLAQNNQWNRLLIVSHDYHLSRIKLCYERLGMSVYTVPARHSYPYYLKLYYFSRELAAWVYYYLYFSGS